jgi:benzodiazapine receptor
MRAIRPFLVFYAISALVAYAGSMFTQMSVTTWYVALNKSPLTPPGAAFGIVWTILYFLMALAATRVYLKVGTWRARALRWWLVQLLLGLLWSMLFFGHRDSAMGMQIIAVTWLAVAFTLALFIRIDRPAGWMLAPLLVWLSFASYLNYYILTHN